MNTRTPSPVISNSNSPLAFQLPDNLVAREPVELRGLSRDDVRLMVLHRTTGLVQHTDFLRLPCFLKRNDLLVFNSSRTLPASLVGSYLPTGSTIEVRLAEHLPNDSWLALLLPAGGTMQRPAFQASGVIEFGPELSLTIGGRDERFPYLWNIRFSKIGTELIGLLHRLGRPIQYEYSSSSLGLEFYQNVYSREPGSAEMPSAGRPFTWKMLFALHHAGVKTAEIVLHAGLSSYQEDVVDSTHPIPEEEYLIGKATAEKVNQALREGNRIIAVGTTVVRALESVAAQDGGILPRHGYTRLHITEGYKLRTVDGVLTGFHEPEASHLDLLSAFIPSEKIYTAYNEAMSLGYRWHEFGDLNLII